MRNKQKKHTVDKLVYLQIIISLQNYTLSLLSANSYSYIWSQRLELQRKM